MQLLQSKMHVHVLCSIQNWTLSILSIWHASVHMVRSLQLVFTLWPPGAEQWALMKIKYIPTFKKYRNLVSVEHVNDNTLLDKWTPNKTQYCYHAYTRKERVNVDYIMVYRVIFYDKPCIICWWFWIPDVSEFAKIFFFILRFPYNSIKLKCQSETNFF